MNRNPIEPTSGAASGVVATLRMIQFAFVGAVVVIGAAAWFLSLGNEYPATWIPWFLGADAVLVVVVCRVVANLRPPLEPSMPIDRSAPLALRAFRGAALARLAAAEGVALMGFVLGIAFTPDSPWPATIGAVLAVILLLTEAAPNRKLAAQVEQRLNSRGAHVQLVDALFGAAGGTPRTTGQSGGIQLH